MLATVSKVTAWANLGYHALRTGIRRLVGGTRGMEAFIENYLDDRLPPLAPEERSLLVALDGCIACGLCDTVSIEIGRSAGADVKSEFYGPSALPISFSRHPPDFEGLEAYLAHLDREDLGRIEGICPARVPFRQLARMVRQVAERSRAGAVG